MIRDITSKYLASLQDDASPSRSPLQQRNRPLRSSKFESPVKPSKLESPDIEDMARQMNLETPLPKPMRARFDTPSATVSAFKNTSGGAASEPKSGPKALPKGDPAAYEYLCRVQAIKNWLQKVLGEDIRQSAAELVSYIQNGIYLAKLANLFLPTQKAVFSDDSRLQFRHTENINRFFKLLQYLEIPSLLHFELTDLYDAKDVPKVFFCLHAMSFKISALGEYPAIENLVGSASFSAADLRVASRALLGHNLPNFASTDCYDMSSPGTNTCMSETLGSPVSVKRPASSKHTRSPSPDGGARAAPENPFLDSGADLRATKMPNLPPISTHLKRHPSATKSFEKSERSFEKSERSFEKSEKSFEKSEKSFEKSEKSFEKSFEKMGSPLPNTIEAHTPNVIMLQALAKGSILRYKMFVKKIMIRSYDSEMTLLYSKIRGNLSRLRSIHVHRDELLLFEEDFVALQAAARSKLSKSVHGPHLDNAHTSSVLNLQSVCRGATIRRHVGEIRRQAGLHHQTVTALQSALRSRFIRNTVSIVLENSELLHPQVLRVQALCRRKLFQQSQRSVMVKSLALEDTKMAEVQAILRGALSRNEVRRKLVGLSRSRANLSELQTVARGAILRTRLCNQVLITLLGEDIKMNELFAKVRGNGVRSNMAAVKAHVESPQMVQAVTQLQAKFRGILVRYQNYVDLEDIYESVGQIIELQAIVRGRKQLRQHNQIREHYTQNVEQVIRAQSILKTKYEQTAYKSFIQMKNPPLQVIRKFAGLLVDSGRDYEEEKQLFDLKEKIIEKCRSNEDLEFQIESIDKKLILLDKNKITIEDFAKNSNKSMKMLKSDAKMISRMSSLPASAQKRIELYQQLFYFLQTKPVYWLRLYEQADPADKPSMEVMKQHIMSIFPIPKVDGQPVVKSREEYFFLRFVTELMQKDFKMHSHNITDITKLKKTFWLDFLVEFNNASHQRLALKRLLGEDVQKLVDEDVDEINFESNPIEIWTELRNKEISVYGSSLKREKVTPQEAIKDKEVNERFVVNLMNLRDFASDVVAKLTACAERVPIHMRILLKKVYDQSKIEYPNSKEFVHLSIAGVIFIKYYINNVLIFPENFGIRVQHAITETNLKYLSRVLFQVFSMKPFNDNFMKPLNDFVMGCQEQVQGAIKSMIRVAELEAEYAMNDWKDLIGHDKPKLTMKLSDMMSVEKMLSKNFQVVIPNLDDQLYSILNELSEKKALDDYVTLTELGSFTLSLVPKTKEDSISDCKRESLFSQAKKDLLFILRVQNVDSNDLLELLIQAITPEHEQRFQQIVREQKASDEAYAVNMPHAQLNAPNLSYKELKKSTLKVLLQLESLGLIRRQDSYQELLNQIVVDIKTKDSQRVTRAQQLVFAAETLARLNDKEAVLSSQLQDYNKHVETMLQQLQSRPKDRKLFNVIPIFSKQYFYHRQLKRSNRLPTFGSYKYSLKKLMEQRVIEDVSGTLYEKTAGSSKCEFMFSCFKSGEFVIEVACGPVTIPGACTTISLDQLLNQQYENNRSWEMFEGMVSFNLEKFSAMIFSKFYDISK